MRVSFDMRIFAIGGGHGSRDPIISWTSEKGCTEEGEGEKGTCEREMAMADRRWQF